MMSRPTANDHGYKVVATVHRSLMRAIRKAITDERVVFRDVTPEYIDIMISDSAGHLKPYIDGVVDGVTAQINVSKRG